VGKEITLREILRAELAAESLLAIGVPEWAISALAQGETAGEHTLVSRATDVNGKVQSTEADLETKRTFLEHSAQFARTVMIS